MRSSGSFAVGMEWAGHSRSRPAGATTQNAIQRNSFPRVDKLRLPSLWSRAHDRKRPDAFIMTPASARPVRAPRGTVLACKGWPQEAAMRMLMNNLDPDVAEDPDRLVVYGGSGRAARSWACFDAIVATLKDLEHDETLLVQSGKPVGVFRTHPGAPRVLIANALIVPAWATFENFRDLEDRGLTMYGQMTAGSWIYIGTQGILQGTYETLASAGRRYLRQLARGSGVRLGGTRRDGRRAAARGHDERRRGAGGRSRSAAHRAPAGHEVRRRSHRQPRRSAGARGAVAPRPRRHARWRSARMPPTCCRRCVARNVVPDLLTDQTSAHDPLNGYVPNGMTLAEAEALRRARSRRVREAVGGRDGRARARDARSEGAAAR